MKLSIIEWSEIILTSIIVVCVLIKLLFWSQLPSGRKVGFPKSFVIWYSIHDLHNASTPRSRRFRSLNNTINIIIWVCVAALLLLYANDTQPADKPPKYDPKKIF